MKSIIVHQVREGRSGARVEEMADSEVAAPAAQDDAAAAASAAPAASYREGISDAQIGAQLEAIHQEVAAEQPLVADPEPAGVLLELYKDNAAFLPKMRDYATKYSSIRRCRGDGQCFFRAFLVSLGEAMVQAGVSASAGEGEGAGAGGAGGASKMQAAYDAVRKTVRGAAELLIALGYSEVTTPDFLDALGDYVDGWGAAGATVDSAVLQPARDGPAFFYCIYGLRLMCSLELQRSEDSYLPYVLGTSDCATVEMYCKAEVETNRDADVLHLMAACNIFNGAVKIVIAYLDASPGTSMQLVTMPETGTTADCATVHLLYRPGHYDIAYPTSAE